MTVIFEMEQFPLNLLVTSFKSRSNRINEEVKIELEIKIRKIRTECVFFVVQRPLDRPRQNQADLRDFHSTNTFWTSGTFQSAKNGEPNLLVHCLY